MIWRNTRWSFLSSIGLSLFVSLVDSQLVKWQASLHFDENIGGLALSKGDKTLFVRGSESIQRVDTETGETFHLHDFSEDEAVSMVPFEQDGFITFLVIMFQNGDMVGYDAQRDVVRWTLHGMAATRDVLLEQMWGSAVYASTQDGTLVCLDTANGARVWSVDKAVAQDTKLHLTRHVVYAVTSSGKVTGYSATDGTVVIQPRFEEMEASFLVDNRLYCWKSHTLLVFDMENDKWPVWATDKLAGTRLQNVVKKKHDRVLVQTDFALVQIHAPTGKVEWTYRPRNPITCVDVSSEDAVYVVETYGDDIGSVLNKVVSGGRREWLFPSVHNIRGNVVVDGETIYFLTKLVYGDHSAQIHAIRDGRSSFLRQPQTGMLATTDIL